MLNPLVCNPLTVLSSPLYMDSVPWENPEDPPHIKVVEDVLVREALAASRGSLVAVGLCRPRLTRRPHRVQNNRSQATALNSQKQSRHNYPNERNAASYRIGG